MADVNANIGVNIDTSEALVQLKALQRQISQFHTSIAKSSEGAAMAQRDLQKNFLNSVNAIGTFSAELRTVKTTAESFTDSLEKNKFSMREYFRFAGGATRTFGQLFKSEFDTIGKVAEDRVKRLQTQYIKLGRDTSGVMKAIAIMPNQLDMSNFSTQSQIAAQKQAIFNQLVKQGSTNLLNFGKNTQWAGRQLMVGFTLPLMALGTAASRTFMEMEQATIKFRKVYGDLFTPETERQQALDDITKLGQAFTQYGVAVSETVGLAAEAAAAGFAGLDLQRQTKEATRLSILGQVESQKALETTISLQNAFKMSSENLASSIDFLNAVENQTVVSLDDITTAIPKVAPVIQQLGGDVKDLAFFMAAMKEGGINASEGANALKSGLAALINPTAKASAMLAGYGINIKKIVEGNQGDLKATVIDFANALDRLDPLTRARAIEQLFGKFQFARLSTLFSNVINETGQASRVLDLAGTSIEDLAALSESELGITADSAMNKFRKSVEDLKFALVPVGQVFLETVTPLLEFAGDILEKFNNMSSGVKKALVVLTVAIGAIGPVALMTFGLLANGLANIIKGAMVLRNGYLRLTGQSQILGEQTEYLTMEQIDAAAASHSLDQAHARLTQTFTVESGAVGQLKTAYEAATLAAAKFAAVNPGMMRAPNVIPTKRAKGKPVVVGGTGNKDTELALLTPGETVIPAEMSKKYGALINGMIADNIPGYKTGRGSLEAGDAEFAISIAAGAQQRSQSKIREFLERELKAVPEELVEDFKSLVRTASQEIQLSEKSLKDRLREFRSQYVANIGQQEELQFAHLDTGRRVKAGELQESGAVVDPKTQARLKTFVDAVGADALVDLKTGFGVELTGFLNNAMQKAGASLEDVITDFEIGGVEKFRNSVEMGGGKMEDFGPELAAFDAKFQQNLEEAYSQGARIIVDSQAQIEQMRQEALAKGETFDDTIYVAMDTVAEQTRQNVLELGSGLDAVFEEAKNRITEIRFQGLTPEQNAALPAGFGRGSKGGRITPGSTSYGRKKKIVGSFRNAPLAQESVANVNAAIAATAQAAGTQSPSKKTIPIGEDIARGLEVGMNNRQDDVAMAGQELATAAVGGTQSGAKRRRRVASRAGGTPFPVAPANATMLPIVPPEPKNKRRFRGARSAGGAPEQISAVSYVAQPVVDVNKEIAAPIVEANKKIVKSTEEVVKSNERQGNTLVSSSDKLASMNKTLNSVTFGLTAMAGAGSMFGGKIGELSSQIFKYSGLMFGLMQITQLLTQAQFARLIAERAATAGILQKTVIDAASGTATFSRTAGLFTGGIKQLLPNLLKFGKMLARFAGIPGLIIGSFFALKFIVGKINKEKEKERLETKALAETMIRARKNIGKVADYFGFTPRKSRLASFVPSKPVEGSVTGTEREKREDLRAALKDDKDYQGLITSLGAIKKDQQKFSLQQVGLQLMASGATAEQAQLYVDTLKEEIGRQNLTFDFKNIKFNKAGLEKLSKDLALSLQNMDRVSDNINLINAEKNIAILKTKYDEAVKQGDKELAESYLKSIDKLKKITVTFVDWENEGQQLGTYIDTITLLFENGNISAEDFRNSFESIRTTIEDVAGDRGMDLLLASIQSINPELATTLEGIKSWERGLTLVEAALSGVEASMISAAIAATMAAQSATEAYNAMVAATRGSKTAPHELGALGQSSLVAMLAEDAMYKKVVERMKTLTKLTESLNKPKNKNGDGEETDIEKAIAQLKKQQTELKNTKKAYELLKKEGVETGRAFEIASDPIFAAAIAAGKVDPSQWKELWYLLKNVNQEIVNGKLLEFFEGRTDEIDLKKSFVEIIPLLKQIGLDSKDIEEILSNPDLARKFIQDLEDGKLDAADLAKYIKQIPELKKITIKLNLEQAADDLFSFLERDAEREYKTKIINAEKEVKDAQDAVDKIQKIIDDIQSGIDKSQRDIEIDITRPIEQMQESINDIERQIEMQFGREITRLQEQSSDMSEDLTIMDKAAESITKKYDKQSEALSKISEINQTILDQQKRQIGLADALSQGDISAAAQAIQEMRSANAAKASKSEQDMLEAAKQSEIDALRSKTGLTRAQITERQYQIERQIYALEELREAQQIRIQAIQDDIYNLEEEREKRLLAIRAEEDKIYNIKNGINVLDDRNLKLATDRLDKAEKNLENLKADLQARLDGIGLLRDAFQATEDAEMAAKITAGEYNDVITLTLGLLGQVEQKWKDISAAAKAAATGLEGGSLPGEDLTRYVAPLSTAADKIAFEDFIDVVEELDAALAAVEAGTGGGQGADAAYDRLQARLAKAQAAYDAILPDSSIVGSSGGGSGGRFGMLSLSSGGMVKPKYFSVGGLSRGTDTIPAMLSPGEFVMSRYAVDNYGVDKMKSINNGTYEGQKVYNYNLSVNVKSDSNPDDIARVVIKQIQQLDNQRIRKQGN